MISRAIYSRSPSSDSLTDLNYGRFYPDSIFLKMEVIMANCEFCNTCCFYNEEPSDKTQTKEILRVEYCNSEFANCARRKMALSRGIDNVPHNLLPDGFKRPRCFCGM